MATRTARRCRQSVPGSGERFLDPEATEYLRASDRARIEYIQSEKWVGYETASDILAKLDELFSFPRRTRMPNLLIVGNTNNGKTAILKRFADMHPRNDNIGGEKAEHPVLRMQWKPGAKLDEFYNGLLDELNWPHFSGGNLDDKRNLLHRAIRELGVRMIMLDEMHHILDDTVPQVRKMLDALKYTANELQLPIVAAGTEVIFHALDTDEQLSNRFLPMWLPRWKCGHSFRRLLASFEAMLPLREASDLASVEMTRKIHVASEGLIGEAANLITAAAVVAIRTKEERITKKTLDSIHWQAPSQRRKGPTV